MTAPMGADRLRVSIETLFRLMLPKLAYLAQWEARVVLVTPGQPPNPGTLPIPTQFITPTTVNCAFVDADAIALFGPAFVNTPIPLWPGASGTISVPAPGSLVRVGFVNGSPQRPFVAGTDPMHFPAASVPLALRQFAAILATSTTDPQAALAAAALQAGLVECG